MKSLGFRSPTLAPSSPSPLPSISLAGSPLSSPGRSPPPPKNAAAATPEPDTSTCGHSAASSPPPPSWPPSAGTRTPTSSPSPSSRSASASTATRPDDATDPDGPPTTPSAWAAPTSPYSPASTSTTAPSFPSGTSCPTGPTGYCRASSAYRSSGARYTATHRRHPTSQAARPPTSSRGERVYQITAIPVIAILAFGADPTMALVVSQVVLSSASRSRSFRWSGLHRGPASWASG